MAEKEGRLRKLSDEEKKAMRVDEKIGETDASQDTLGGILDNDKTEKSKKIEKFLNKIKEFIDGFDDSEKEQVGKSISSVIAPYYEITKQIHYDNNDVGGGYRDATTWMVPEEDKPRVMKELMDSQYVTNGITGFSGKSKELSKTGGEKTTTIQAYNPAQEDFLEKLGLLRND